MLATGWKRTTYWWRCGRHERVGGRSPWTRYLRNGCARHQAIDMHNLCLMRLNMLYPYNYFRLKICYSVRTEPKWVSLRFCWRSNGFGQYNQTSWTFVNETTLTRASKYDFWVFDDRFVALRTRSWAARILSLKWILYRTKFGVSSGGAAINEQGRRTSLPIIA